MLAVGITQGPPHHYWYLTLDKYLPGKKEKLKDILDIFTSSEDDCQTFSLRYRWVNTFFKKFLKRKIN